MKIPHFLRRALSLRPASPLRPCLRVEELESRLVPTTSGNAWPAPQMITLSFVPDGTIIGANSNGNITSNLFAKMNAHRGWTTATWQNAIIKAAQSWAQQTNINLQVVADSGAPSGSGNYQQGDAQWGDIRIGGYNFGANYLAEAYMPPPVNNFDIAGDISFNTAYNFNIGTTYDLYSVASHEIGHALGLYHSTSYSSVMYSSYTGVKTALGSDDVTNIRSIYSAGNARSADQYAGDNSFLTAANLTAGIDPVALTEVKTGLDVTNAGETDYYTFTAPTGSSGTLTVSAQTAGLSLLRQAVTVYDADQTTVLGSASSANAYNGTTDTVTVSGITAGHVYYVKVAGADNTAFGTGAYALTLNFGTGASPIVPLPNTQLANGNPLQAGGGEAEMPPLPSSVWGKVSVNYVVSGFDMLEAPAPPDGGAVGQPHGGDGPKGVDQEGGHGDGGHLQGLVNHFDTVLPGPADDREDASLFARALADASPARTAASSPLSSPSALPTFAWDGLETEAGQGNSHQLAGLAHSKEAPGEQSLDSFFADADLMSSLTARTGP